MTRGSRSALGAIAFVSLLWLGHAAADGLPDVLGIRLAMPLKDARAQLQAQLPKNRMVEQTMILPTIDRPVVNSLSSGPAGSVSISDEADYVIVDVTTPPNEQIVWRVVRRHTFADRGIPKATLLASLREKYGKETAANLGRAAAANDSQISTLLWFLDEQGRPAALATGDKYQAMLIVSTCNDNGTPRTLDLVEVYATLYKGKNPQQDWCYAHYTAVYATVSESSPPELYSEMNIEVVSSPMAFRAAEASAKWKKGLEEQQHKQELEKASQQAKPKL